MARRKVKIPDTVGELLTRADVGDILRQFQAEVAATDVVVVGMDSTGEVVVYHSSLSNVQALGMIEVAKSILLDDSHGSDEGTG